MIAAGPLRRSLSGLTAAFALLAAAMVWAGDLAVRGDIVYPVSGDPIEDGVVLIRDGLVQRVGPADRVRIPDGVRVLEAAVVTPGFVDARTTIGLSGIYGGREGQVRDQDQLETSDPVQPDLDPVDAYNAQDPLVAWVRQYGVTTMHTGHGPGAVVSGRTMVVKTRGRTVEDALLERDTALAITLGESSSRNFESPGTRAKSVALLRAAFVAAQGYRDKLGGDNPPGRDLAKEVLLAVLEGDMKAMITAHTITDIAAALRLQEEFGLDLLLDGAASAHLLTDELLEADVPVLLHAPMLRAGGEAKNASFEAAQRLREAGVRFALQTGFEGYVPKARVLLFEATIAAANGLGLENTLRAITLTPAELLGIDDRVGSIERGKHGDLVLFDGDPFEYTTHVCGVVIEGDLVSDSCW